MIDKVAINNRVNEGVYGDAMIPIITIAEKFRDTPVVHLLKQAIDTSEKLLPIIEDKKSIKNLSVLLGDLKRSKKKYNSNGLMSQESKELLLQIIGMNLYFLEGCEELDGVIIHNTSV